MAKQAQGKKKHVEHEHRHGHVMSDMAIMGLFVIFVGHGIASFTHPQLVASTYIQGDPSQYTDEQFLMAFHLISANHMLIGGLVASINHLPRKLMLLAGFVIFVGAFVLGYWCYDLSGAKMNGVWLMSVIAAFALYVMKVAFDMPDTVHAKELKTMHHHRHYLPPVLSVPLFLAVAGVGVAGNLNFRFFDTFLLFLCRARLKLLCASW